MSFEPVVPSNHGGSSVGIRAAIRIDRATSRPGAGMKFVMAVGDDVMSFMRWQPGIKMTILRGTNSDIGKLRLSHSPGTGYTLSKLHTSKNGNKQYGLRLPIFYGMPKTPHRMTACEWRLADNKSFIEVRLPSWSLSEHEYSLLEAAE